MKSPITTSILAVLAAISFLSQATAQVTIDWVAVGNAGNAADNTGFGAVGYEYGIGKYEVTNAQYTVFLNAVSADGSNPNGIYNANMGSDARGGISFDTNAAAGSKYSVKANMGNKPVNFVSWYDAARFTNWLHNGQGSGSTETGAYTLNNATTGIFTKNAGARVWLPSENEWYKAAYYDPTLNSGAGGYWDYATRSDAIPRQATANTVGDISNPGANVVNYQSFADWNGQDGNVTTVGSAGAASESFFGTADQSGNLWEWNDVVHGTTRGRRGGPYNLFAGDVSSGRRQFATPGAESVDLGFRVAVIPEPSGLVLTLLIGAGFVCHRRRSL